MKTPDTNFPTFSNRNTTSTLGGSHYSYCNITLLHFYQHCTCTPPTKTTEIHPCLYYISLNTTLLLIILPRPQTFPFISPFLFLPFFFIHLLQILILSSQLIQTEKKKIYIYHLFPLKKKHSQYHIHLLHHFNQQHMFNKTPRTSAIEIHNHLSNTTRHTMFTSNTFHHKCSHNMILLVTCLDVRNVCEKYHNANKCIGEGSMRDHSNFSKIYSHNVINNIATSCNTLDT